MRTESTYLGVRLPHPFIVGASPLGVTLDGIKRLEGAGAAAIVLHSLFEEQLSDTSGTGERMPPANWADPRSGFPLAADYPLSPDDYAEHITRAKRCVRIPIIASLNGCTGGSWLRFASVLEQAGADGLELNLYEVVTGLDVPGTFIESRLIDTVRELKRTLRLPIAVKLSPFFSAFGNVAHKLDLAGADALVMFNRFYQPDIDSRSMETAARVELSTNVELRLRLRWTASLYGRVRPALAISGGVASPPDAIKALLAGADVVQLVSVLLRHGTSCLRTMVSELERWLDWADMESLDDMRGQASLKASGDPAAFERASYIRALLDFHRAPLPKK